MWGSNATDTYDVKTSSMSLWLRLILLDHVCHISTLNTQLLGVSKKRMKIDQLVKKHQKIDPKSLMCTFQWRNWTSTIFSLMFFSSYLLIGITDFNQIRFILKHISISIDLQTQGFRTVFQFKTIDYCWIHVCLGDHVLLCWIWMGRDGTWIDKLPI